MARETLASLHAVIGEKNRELICLRDRLSVLEGLHQHGAVSRKLDMPSRPREAAPNLLREIALQTGLTARWSAVINGAVEVYRNKHWEIYA